LRIRLNSAQLKLNLPVGAELGNTICDKITHTQKKTILYKYFFCATVFASIK
jgi:hypothetical protein